MMRQDDCERSTLKGPSIILVYGPRKYLDHELPDISEIAENTKSFLQLKQLLHYAYIVLLVLLVNVF